MTQGTGKYGTQNYSFSANGNLIQKGAYTLGYTDGNHANAVTTATSASTGTLNYGYDASGNMISRNGDVLRYDSYGKLVEITPYAASSSVRNTYDFAGNRVKSVSDITLISTYTLGENYEILREPGKPEKHTLYVRGLHGDLVAQWTREDATLQIADGDGGKEIQRKSSDFSIGSFVGRTIVGAPTEEDRSKRSRISLFVGVPTNPFCKDVVGDCGSYYKNRLKTEFLGIFGYSKYFQDGVPTSRYNVFYYLLLLGILYLSYPYFLKGNELLQRLGWKGVGTPTLILSLFVVTSLPGCGILPGTGGKQGDPPWVLALGANVTPGVPSIQNPGVGMTGGGSVGGVPVTGMFFFHPDHLGSITMITDGAGNPASGPEPGTSFVSYEPYGSIIRNDSYGPDIFRYKFTGQIEDKETGLYYYKARYYEPALGRFLQADSVIDSDAPNGQNRYMYVEGNPVNFRDPSGHVSGAGLMHMMNRMIGHAMGKDFGKKGFDKRLSASGVSTGWNRFFKRGFSVATKGGTKKGWEAATLAYYQTEGDLVSMVDAYFKGNKAGKQERKNKEMRKVALGVTYAGIIVITIASGGLAVGAFVEANAVAGVIVGTIMTLGGASANDTLVKDGVINWKNFIYTCGVEGTSGVNIGSQWDGSISVGSKGCFAAPQGE
ncbi:RHS repeat-associated core domain protein [Leptospira sp. Fiocruz LV3954]|nr:RHS repeat-associated core domain protein [Leptospira sp. Fiocruz LV3954]